MSGKLLESLKALGSHEANSPGIGQANTVDSSSTFVGGSIDELILKLGETEPEVAKIVKEVEANSIRIMIERGGSYKDAYAVLGLHSALAQVLHKAERVKALVAHPDPADGFKLSPKEIKESKEVKDSLLDLLNYVRLTLVQMNK